MNNKKKLFEKINNEEKNYFNTSQTNNEILEIQNFQNTNIDFININKDDIKSFTYQYEEGCGETYTIKNKKNDTLIKTIKETPAGLYIETNTRFNPSLYDSMSEFLIEEKILYLYEKENLTQDKISEITGVAQSTISRTLRKYGYHRGKKL